MPPSKERRDLFGEPLALKDRVLFSYNNKLEEAVIFDLNEISALPILTLSSLDGKQQTRVIDKDVCKIHLVD